MEIKRICIDWETDGIPIEEIGLLTEVNVPNDIDTADWLSDEYGFLVNGFRFV